MKPVYCFAIGLSALMFSCTKDDIKDGPKEDPATFREISSIDIGDQGAAEITAFDPKTNRLFVVNNGSTNKIDVLDFANPATPVLISSIELAGIGGLVNSLSVSDGVLAAAVESVNKTEPGKVALFHTTTYALIKTITVGALPDMITFSPDGKYILTANEGEPSSDYLTDPEGTVSIISVQDNHAVTTIGFSAFVNQLEALRAKGLRVFGPKAAMVQDLEPEYITVSDDSRTAWVTLQENNAIARIDLRAKTITAIFPLGFKDYNNATNAVDLSDADNAIEFAARPVKGMYQPDAIGVYTSKGLPYLFTANEGDARDYSGFSEVKRVGATRQPTIELDPAVFPNPAALKNNAVLGRLNVTTTLGNTDNDPEYEALYSFGARSFSVWNGTNGQLLFDSGNELDVIAKEAGKYNDGRSDDKSVEPEGLAIGEVGKQPILFVGLERAKSVAVYNISNPLAPRFLQLLPAGEEPEGVLFISAKDSPTKKSLLVVSSEGDGVIRIYSPER